MSRLPIKPGVFVQNARIQPQSIEGVNTSNAAFLGEPQIGLVTPTLVTSFTEYQRLFGGYFGPDKYLPYAVEGFFANGGKRCFVCSVNDGNYAGALAKLEAVDASIIYVPNAQATTGLADELISHCERLRNRFAIFDSLKGQDPSNVTKPSDSSFAALYYP
jgi:phage tail sheath protein FI